LGEEADGYIKFFTKVDEAFVLSPKTISFHSFFRKK